MTTEFQDTINKVVTNAVIDAVLKLSEKITAEEIMTRKEAAVFLSVTAHTIDNYKKQKKLPVFYLGDKPRFKKSDLLKLLIAPIQNN